MESMFGNNYMDETNDQGQDTSAQKEQKQYRNKTIPVSIKMLNESEVSSNFKQFDGHETSQVSILARITAHTDTGNNLILSLNDDSAICDVTIYKKNGDLYPKYWTDIQDNFDTNGLYVKCTINISVFKDKIAYNCVQMRPVYDQNEQSRFLLDISLRHLQRVNGIKNIDTKPAQSNQNQPQQQKFNSNQDPTQQIISCMQQFKDNQQDQVTVQQIQQQLSHLSVNQIKQQLENLKNNHAVFDVGNTDTYQLI